MKFLFFVSSLILTLFVNGCAHVHPWERGVISSQRMQLNMTPETSAFVLSRRRTREEGSVISGSNVSATTSGGGCGCN